MTAPDTRTSGFDSNARGLTVLAVAVVVGLLLLLNAGGNGSAEQVATEGTDDPPSTIDISNLGDDTEPEGSEGTDTTTADQTTSSSIAETSDTRLPSEVKVLVLNGCGSACPGVAGVTSDTIGEKGYVMQEADNASSQLETTTIYYADGYQADADAVAAVLGRSPDAVAPMPSTSPGPGAEGSNVVVVLGGDTPPVSSASEN